VIAEDRTLALGVGARPSPPRSRPPGPPLAKGADRDRLVALLVEMQGELSAALRSVDNAERSLADLDAWLARVEASAGRLAACRARLPRPDGFSVTASEVR
jgi:hypothetical protein